MRLPWLVKGRTILKTVVDDPQRLEIEGGVRRCGVEAVQDVRVGRYLEIWLSQTSEVAAEESVAEMCRKLLANPVSEHYLVEAVAVG